MKGFPSQHNALSDRWLALFGLKGPLVSRKEPFVDLKRLLSGRHRKISIQHSYPLGRKQTIRSKHSHFRPKKGTFRLARASQVSTRPFRPIQQRALLGRKRASGSWIGPFVRSKRPSQLVERTPPCQAHRLTRDLPCIVVALFEVGFARALPKVYKSPPLFEMPVLFQNESMPSPIRSS